MCSSNKGLPENALCTGWVKLQRDSAQHQCHLGAFARLARGTGEEAKTLFRSFHRWVQEPWLLLCLQRGPGKPNRLLLLPTAAWRYGRIAQ